MQDWFIVVVLAHEWLASVMHSVEFYTGAVMGTNPRDSAGDSRRFGDEKIRTVAGIERTGVNIVGIPR